MVEKKEKAESQKERKVKPAGSLFTVVFLLSLEQHPIELIIKKSPSSSLTRTVLFAAVLLYDFIFVVVFGMTALFNLVSKTIGKYPKDSILLKLDSMIDNASWWLLGGLIFGRWILQIIVMAYYPISAFE
jgi:hypothetical protein